MPDQKKKRMSMPAELRQYMETTVPSLKPISMEQLKRVSTLLALFFLKPTCTTVHHLLHEKMSCANWYMFMQHIQNSVGKPMFQTMLHGQTTLGFFPSMHTIAFLTNMMHDAVHWTNSHFVVGLKRGSGLTEAHLQVAGVPMEIIEKPPDLVEDDLFSTWPEEDDKGKSHVLYTEWLPTVDGVNLLHYILRVQPKVLFIAGPCEMLIYLNEFNTQLICEHGYHRLLYELKSIAFTHSKEDGMTPSVLLLVYFIDPTYTFSEKHLLASPINALRFHTQRHVFQGDYESWWTQILPRTPLKVLLAKTCQLQCCQDLIQCFMTNEPAMEQQSTLVSKDDLTTLTDSCYCTNEGLNSHCTLFV
jgi:hypothetical protein